MLHPDRLSTFVSVVELVQLLAVGGGFHGVSAVQLGVLEVVVCGRLQLPVVLRQTEERRRLPRLREAHELPNLLLLPGLQLILQDIPTRLLITYSHTPHRVMTAWLVKGVGEVRSDMWQQEEQEQEDREEEEEQEQEQEQEEEQEQQEEEDREAATAAHKSMIAVCVLVCCGLMGALAGLQKDHVAQQAIKLHRGRGAAPSNTWLVNSCKRLAGLLRQKKMVVGKLSAAADAVGRDQTLSDPERLFQVHTLEVFQKELNESESLVFQAVVSLHRALQGDYRDVVNMKDSSRLRLEALREAAIKEEQEYVELVAAEKHQQEALKSALAQNKTLSMLDEILEDVRRAADRLEEEIEEHAFDNNKQMKGVNVEAVLRVEEDEENGGERRNVSRRRDAEA
ncbi:Transmembrane and coiled-coil domain-containing protein 3 [Merluccius polli]|uniref:Transmembrane and coiled-coil domain-containing protein 3 n=1 Tax=Merluccius polli TaxID=89951 RepID=A0AA47MMQ2_MERPO|nr:Transmembrane and coiled-coil domain-containing protein 3 [Merluccius polli]